MNEENQNVAAAEAGAQFSTLAVSATIVVDELLLIQLSEHSIDILVHGGRKGHTDHRKVWQAMPAELFVPLMLRRATLALVVDLGIHNSKEDGPVNARVDARRNEFARILSHEAELLLSLFDERERFHLKFMRLGKLTEADECALTPLSIQDTRAIVFVGW